MLVAAERDRFDLAGWLEKHPNERFGVSAVTLSELWFGVLRATSERRGHREAFVRDIADVFPIHPFDAPTARVHAEIWSDLALRGQLIGAHDLLIAATAISAQMGLATLNLKEFRRIRDLKVIDPSA